MEDILPAVTKDEIQLQVVLAFRRRHVTVDHPPIVPTDHLGGWKIGEIVEHSREEWSATRPIEVLRQEVEDELRLLYSLTA
jgi:hypothetical protein